MAITLRNVKGTELSHAEMDTNFESFYYSSSLSGNTLTLHTTGSTAHSHDIPDTNIANTGLSLSGNRTVTLNNYGLTFDAIDGETFTVAADNNATVLFQMDSGDFKISNLPNTETPVVLGYNTTSGQLSYYSTGSFGSGGGGSIDTGSFYVSSSINTAGNVITFKQGDGTNESVTVDTTNYTARYDITNKSTTGPGTSRPSHFIAGGSVISSGGTTKTIRIPEIADKDLGDDVFITATYVGGDTDTPITVQASGATADIPRTINSSGEIDFKAGGSTLSSNTYFMYHIIYTE